ncbi:hypothetical protein GUJ93_ZPchr0138g32 [Zizania palustris]|uniref:Uncharacterized protein n=1 Tax=Zizania palustris TaxID=103762 RepID=A0A8J5R2S3_ZIZPA|nr:hypothetical protein GUJ93_ZPchr0138g32 [Zizania palustris]
MKKILFRMFYSILEDTPGEPDADDAPVDAPKAADVPVNKADVTRSRKDPTKSDAPKPRKQKKDPKSPSSPEADKPGEPKDKKKTDDKPADKPVEIKSTK